MSPREFRNQNKARRGEKKKSSQQARQAASRSAGAPSTTTVTTMGGNQKSEAFFKPAALRILKLVRSLRLRQRPCAREFEHRPNPELFPVYYKLIAEPVSLHDIEAEILIGDVASPEALSSKFKLLVRNAKSFNKPGSTISKDATRLYDTFREAMKSEFGSQLEEYEDEDEDDAWARDLVTRIKLAAEEREAYKEILASWDYTPNLISRKTPEDLSFRSFTKEPLAIFEVPESKGKREVSRSQLVEEMAKVKFPLGKASNACKLGTCLICTGGPARPADPRMHHHVHTMPVHAEVLTPKYREIVPPSSSTSSSSQAKRRSASKLRIEAPAEVDRSLKRHTSARAAEVSSPPPARIAAKKSVTFVEPTSTSMKKSLRKRAESPDHVSELAGEVVSRLKRVRC